MFEAVTKLKHNIEDDSKRFKVRITRTITKSDVKSSE